MGVDLILFDKKSSFLFLRHYCQRYQPGEGNSQVELSYHGFKHGQQARQRVNRSDVAVSGSGESDVTEIDQQMTECIWTAGSQVFGKTEGTRADKATIW